jgi:TolB-like protein/cytochrome c-type biogenesis protein CcmH/NrfG
VYAFKRELDTWRRSRQTIEGVTPAETATGQTARLRPKLWLALLAVAAFAAAIAWVGRTRLPRHSVSSIAVLPFENLSKNAEDEWFSDGMTETLITELSRVRSLRVISRTSVMQYKNTHTPLKQIRDELGVDAIVEGSALRDGDRVRITAQLIESSTDLHLWGSDYDREFKDVLGLHREVARAIAQDVGATLTASEQVRLHARRPVNPEAMEAYLKGLYILNRREMKRAIELAREAIRLDPQFFQAHELLGEALMIEADSHQVTYAEVLPEARAALRRSLEIEPDQRRPIALLGYSLFVADHNWEEAEPGLRRSFELDPGSGCAYGFFLSAREEFDKAIEACRQELLRDLANPATHTDMGMLYHFARRYGESIASFRKALDLSPDNQYPHYYLPFTYVLAGQLDEGFRLWLPWITRPRSPLAGREGRLGTEYRSGGWNAVWRAYLEMKPRDPRMRLRAYLALQRKEEAFVELDGLEKMNDSWTSRLQDPIYDSIRREPRFQAMRKRLRYPESTWR